MKDYRYIEIKEGNEYHALVDSSQNIYDEKNFFYPVYAKSAKLVKEICRNSSKESNACQNNEIEHKDYSNNIIMYCAERGGGKSTSMLSFANALKNFNEEQSKHSAGFIGMWGEKFTDSTSFLVLSAIDPTEISESDLFLRIVFSKMFSKLSDKWKKEDSRIRSDTIMNGDINYKKISRNRVTKKFTECYRYLDVIYQKKGQFEYDDDLDDLTDLGDSGNLRGRFWDLVKSYLEEMTGSNKNFLVIQIDDADLNSNVTYKMIEDIRKYCIIPNVIILMSVNIVQMHYVLEQNFVTDFKPLLDVSRDGDRGSDAKSIHLRDCQKMAMRYIDKVMPAAHQIHLPKTEDYINNIWDLKINYNFADDENDSKTVEFLSFKDKSGNEITNYQEIFIHLIYKKTGIVIVKPDGYIHNILPKTMRGLSHFLAYMRQLPDLDEDLGMAEINELLNVLYGGKPVSEIKGKNKDDAEVELRKRIDNLEALRLYFLKNWCTVRLTKRYQEAVEDIDKTVVELKVKAASSWIDRLFKDKFEFVSELSPDSYAFLREKLQRLTLQAHRMENASVIYHFVYALRFYFLLEFNRTFLACVKNGKNSEGNNSNFENSNGVNFGEIFKLTNYEMWAPSVALLDENDPLTKFGHFKVNHEILKIYRANTFVKKGKTEEKKTTETGNTAENQAMESGKEIKNVESPIVSTISDSVTQNCFIQSGDKKYFLGKQDVSNDIDSLPKGSEIVADLGFSLLYSLINDEAHGEDLKTYYSNLKYKNCLIALLSSWELQRYVEKKSGFIFESKNEQNDLDGANRQFIKNTFDCLDEIKYLPIDFDIEEKNLSKKPGILILMFANEELVPLAVKALFESIQNTDHHKNKSNETAEKLGDKLDESPILDSDMDKLKMLSGISKKAENVYENLHPPITDKGEKTNTKSYNDYDEVVKVTIDEIVASFKSKDKKEEEKPERCFKLLVNDETVKKVATQVIAMLDEKKQVDADQTKSSTENPQAIKFPQNDTTEEMPSEPGAENPQVADTPLNATTEELPSKSDTDKP